IWANTVSDPCPISTVPVYKDRLASSLSLTTAQEIDGVIVALIMQASPLPRRTLPIDESFLIFALPVPSDFHPIDSATRFRHSFRPTERRVSSVTNLSPSSYPFFFLISSGSIWSATAMMSICDSTAQADCDTPKPRNALAGGLFV